MIYEWFLSKTATESSKNIEHFRKNIVYDGSYVDVVSNKENVHTHKYTSSIEKVHKKDIDSHTDLIRIQNTKNYGKYRNIICKITIKSLFWTWFWKEEEYHVVFSNKFWALS